MASYWVRKDDKDEELRTVKPWDESVANGDKFIPDPDHKETSKDE